jgi:hypothetical protein
MLTAEDLLIAYARLAPKPPDDELPDPALWRGPFERVYRAERRDIRRDVFRRYRLDAWADLRLPCHREARADLVRQWRSLAAHRAKNYALFAAREARMVAKLDKITTTLAETAATSAATAQLWKQQAQEIEAAGLLAKLALTRADLEQCQTLDVLMNLVYTALERLLAGQGQE